jgi:hypothetical protein
VTAKKGKVTKARVVMPLGLDQLEFKPEEVPPRTVREWYVELTAGLATQSPGSDGGLTARALLTLYGFYCAISALFAPAVAEGDQATACRVAEMVGGEIGRRDSDPGAGTELSHGANR